MADIQASLLNESDEDVITPLCQTILLAALDDPGVEGQFVSESKLLELLIVDLLRALACVYHACLPICTNDRSSPQTFSIPCKRRVQYISMEMLDVY